VVEGLTPGAERLTRLRDKLIVALTVLTGVTDAVAFVRLGNVFTSVMTGNMVLMGIAVGQPDLSALWHAGLAVLSYIVGAMAGGSLSGRADPDDGVWPARVTVALVIELVLFVVVNVVWMASDADLGATGQISLAAVAALALGIQSSAVIRLNVSGMSTTYLTGTLTHVARSLIVERNLRGNGRAALTLVALVGGGALGAWLAHLAPEVALLPPVAILLGVLALGRTRLKDAGQKAGAQPNRPFT
jgi:uncharacterized membrane protein YoaK (UPF0700 family)